MKNNLLTLFLIAGIIFFAVAPNAFAVLTRPLSGIVLVSPVAGITCPSSSSPGQFTVKPYNTASPGPYLILFNQPKNIPRPGSYFKGLYFSTPLPLCNSGNAPVSTLLIVPFKYQSTQ